MRTEDGKMVELTRQDMADLQLAVEAKMTEFALTRRREDLEYGLSNGSLVGRLTTLWARLENLRLGCVEEYDTRGRQLQLLDRVYRAAHQAVPGGAP